MRKETISNIYIDFFQKLNEVKKQYDNHIIALQYYSSCFIFIKEDIDLVENYLDLETKKALKIKYIEFNTSDLIHIKEKVNNLGFKLAVLSVANINPN